MSHPVTCLLGRSLLALAALTLTLFESSAQSRPAYRFGPGDTVNIHVLGRPETKVEGLPVAPDGTISYQNNRVSVAGRTVSEARQAVETELQKVERNVRVVLTPGGIGSKSYTILGQVPDQGRYTLDRPVSLLEAIARAGGLTKEDAAVGVVNQRVNLDQSFLVRRGRKLNIDFTKLYAEGDTKQNITLQHEDHIYIASNLDDEFYVFGYVQNQGMQRVRPGLGVVGAIVEQAGFAEGAWKGKVLLVRGSMTKPETIVVDVSQVLKARQADVPIKPGDILYVHREPWYHAENILDSALTGFLRAAATTKVDIETRLKD